MLNVYITPFHLYDATFNFTPFSPLYFFLLLSIYTFSLCFSIPTLNFGPPSSQMGPNNLPLVFVIVMSNRKKDNRDPSFFFSFFLALFQRKYSLFFFFFFLPSHQLYLFFVISISSPRRGREGTRLRRHKSFITFACISYAGMFLK